MTSEQPRTAAGRALVDMPLHTAGIGSDRDDDRLRKAVLTIELQAALPPEVFSRFVRRLELELAAPDPASPAPLDVNVLAAIGHVRFDPTGNPAIIAVRLDGHGIDYRHFAAEYARLGQPVAEEHR